MGKNVAPRVMATVHRETYQLLQEAAEKTGVSVSGIVARALNPFADELVEYLRWLNSIEPGSRKHMYAVNLLASFGPETLREGIRRLDPSHVFADEEFERHLRAKQNESQGTNNEQ